MRNAYGASKNLKNGKSIGTIYLNEIAILSDPCYTLGTWCQEELKNVLPGDYEVVWYEANDRWDGHVMVLTHLKYSNTTFPRELIATTLGIDSGQVGVYALEEYRKDECVPHNAPLEFGSMGDGPSDHWYAAACTGGVTIIGNGVTSASGYGDGTAEAYVSRNKDGKVYRIAINF